MRWSGRGQVFRDECSVPLTRSQADRAARQARRAALEAQETVTLTARRQYRRYRARAGDVFLDWPRWHAHYLDAYHLEAPGRGREEPMGRDASGVVRRTVVSTGSSGE